MSKHGLIMSYPIEGLQGADYNPREIDDESIHRLQHSLKTIGICKPIIVRGTTIVAGHQRTRALRAMGETHAPVYLLAQNATVYDEVRFNQLHNGTDMDIGDEAVCVPLPQGARGFVSIEPTAIDGNLRSKGAAIRNEIMNLMHRYGAWGAAVCDASGHIFHAAQYALACKTMGKELLVFVVDPEIEDEARKLLDAQYGKFSYKNLDRDTYIQTFAQMFRLRGGAKEQRSPTYEGLIIPWLGKHPSARVLDFGCGQGDYVNHLARKGYNIIGMEFFRRAKGRDAIDIKAVNKMVDALCASLSEHGLFDAVVCDYVMNSVDSQQAEEDVLTCLSAFCKPNGRIFFSGRSKERIEKQMRYTQIRHSQKRQLEFLDENGLSALYRKGKWFYQKFHSQIDIDNILAKMGWKLVKLTRSDVAWQAAATFKGSWNQARQGEALDREFNMVMGSSGRTLNRHSDIKEALQCQQSYT